MSRDKQRTIIDDLFTAKGMAALFFIAFLITMTLWISADRKLESAEKYIRYLHNNIPSNIGKQLNKEYNQEMLDRFDTEQEASGDTRY